MSNVWGSPNGKDYIIAAKGAPEAIIDLCHVKQPEAKEISECIQKMAKEGLRILGVAKTSFKIAGATLPKDSMILSSNS
jgi:Ca2+-transporting ATPase